MSTSIISQYIITFLNKHALAVLSTVDATGNPHGAPIYFVMDTEKNLYFVTPTKTQKNLNLESNPQVALTVVNEATKEMAQIRGVAAKDDALLPEILPKLAEKINGDEKMATDLPLLRYKDQEKTVVKVSTKTITFRRYSEEGLEEKALI